MTAAARQAATPVVKTRQFEGGQLDYQLYLNNDPRVSYDGQASLRTRDGFVSYVVVLNRAFFSREAVEILHRLQRAASADPTPAFLSQLLTDLTDLEHSKPAADLSARLTMLQTYLENLAWQGLYAECRATYTQTASAERCFRDAFVERRLATVEEHEVAHLIDLATQGDDGSAAFARFTELNAFYAELLRGNNPLDTMSQAFVGLNDELRHGQNVDYSTEKVRRVLKFLQTCPRYRMLLANRGPAPCCLELLTKMSREDFAFAARELRRQNHFL